jgi:transposase
MARPTKLTPTVEKKIVDAIRAGNYAKVAAECAGISERTYDDWLQRGESGDAPFSEFARAVARASAEAEVEAVALICKAMHEDWRAALEYLKRRHPERWQDRSKTELSGKDGQLVEIRFAYDPENP